FFLLLFFFCFFFQAEDGIRDRNVTGVQTCALPILIDETVQLPISHQPEQLTARPSQPPRQHEVVVAPAPRAQPRVCLDEHPRVRSEERRVGKECRCGGGPAEYKKRGSRCWCRRRRG